MEKIFKRSAIHNLVISDIDLTHELNEGLVIPKSIMDSCDIIDYEQIIITNINGDNWKNRIKTFVVSGNNNKVIARGSLANFFKVGDTTCIISYTRFSEMELDLFYDAKFPILDLGFKPNPESYNINNYKVSIEHYSKKMEANTKAIKSAILKRRQFKRILLANLIIGLRINNTHPDCLHGSAELPKSIMEAANLNQYQHVLVYNSSAGGAADTYAVSMPEGVIMTTGAMAKFAKLGETVNISSYIETYVNHIPKIIITDGTGITKSY